MKIKTIHNSRELTNLIDLDVLVSVLRLGFYILESDTSDLRISYIQILKHLNFAAYINKDRIKSALFSLINVSFDIDGLEMTPIILKVDLKNEDYVIIHFHTKVLLALKRGYFFDGWDYMPLKSNNKEAIEKVKI